MNTQRVCVVVMAAGMVLGAAFASDHDRGVTWPNDDPGDPGSGASEFIPVTAAGYTDGTAVRDPFFSDGVALIGDDGNPKEGLYAAGIQFVDPIDDQWTPTSALAGLSTPALAGDASPSFEPIEAPVEDTAGMAFLSLPTGGGSGGSRLLLALAVLCATLALTAGLGLVLVARR